MYSLLLLNWAYYAVEEFYIASHVLREGGTFLQWTQEFATTIDEFAWFGLLFAFELETYALDESLEKRWVKWSVHGLRLVCYVFLAHTVYARVASMTDVNAAQVAPEITSLCQVAGQEISFVKNYDYEIVTKDAIMWLLVVWAIELTVWLQNRNITGGVLMLASYSARLGYLVLMGHAVFWAWSGHWVWAWDQFLWIAGFWAIENNLSEWREDLRDGLQVFTSD